MLTLILVDVQYSRKAVFSFEKDSNHQNHSSWGSLHLVKILPQKISREFTPSTPYRYLENPDSCNSFVRYFYSIWSIESILVNNSITEILPDMRFAMESQVPQPSPSTEISCKSSDNIEKKYKMPYFGTLFTRILAKMKFVQNYAMSVLRWKNFTSWKNQKKLCY